MEKLSRIEIEKKISEIVFWELPYSNTTASCHVILQPHVMLINLKGVYAKNEKFWEENVVTIITHEHLHGLLYKIAGMEACDALDNLWTTTRKSRFLVDGDTNHFEWRSSKRNRKHIS